MSFLNPINSAYAADYLERHIYVVGDMIGVITSGTDKSPLQSSLTATGIDLTSVDTNGYVAYFG
jgi:hypothetical protein